jgi:diguanylate cyclase (GGDEF)-like protein
MEYVYLFCAIVALMAGFIIFYNRYNNNFYRRLFELEEVFDGELNFVHLTKNILGKIVKETTANAGIIYWFDEIQDEFKLKSIIGVPTDQINNITRILRRPKGVLEQLKTEPKAYILDLKRKNGLVASANLQELSEMYRNIMVLPLNVQKKTLGTLILIRDNGAFSRRQLRLLSFFAPRAAVRLDNIRLYQLAKETALENAKLYVNISKLYQKATLDELTGFYNRNFLMQRVKEEIKKAYRLKYPLALIFIDLDFFKNVNDQYGHQVGDQLLAEFGDLIKGSIREYDVACRFGGEEFVILLPQTETKNAVELAERLREKIEKRKFCVSYGNLQITASFGVSSLPQNDVKQLDEEQTILYMENLIAWADDALYQAKKNGRNRVVLYKEVK